METQLRSLIADYLYLTYCLEPQVRFNHTFQQASDTTMQQREQAQREWQSLFINTGAVTTEANKGALQSTQVSYIKRMCTSAQARSIGGRGVH